MSGFTTSKIVVPIDFSDESFEAVDAALDIAGDAKKVHVVHVLQELNVVEPGVNWLTIDNESRGRQATQALHERLSDAKYDGVPIHIEIGDAGLRVTDYAQEIGADLIVTPSHGRTGLRRLLIGSVAERIVRLAHCPVLVLRK